MAIGKVNYKTGQNLEPIASAITSMNQSSTKKDKPIEMAQKIKEIWEPTPCWGCPWRPPEPPRRP